MYSKFRPHVGTRAMLTPGPSRIETPTARHSSAMAAATRRSRSRFHEAARATGAAKAVPGPKLRTPAEASEHQTRGSPRRGTPGIPIWSTPPSIVIFSSRLSAASVFSTRSPAGSEGPKAGERLSGGTVGGTLSRAISWRLM
jgi:hypothetical protein